MRARLSPPASSSLTHARRMDGFCNQNADQLGSLAGQSLLTVYVCVVECAPASPPPASSSLTHARWLGCPWAALHRCPWGGSVWASSHTHLGGGVRIHPEVPPGGLRGLPGELTPGVSRYPIGWCSVCQLPALRTSRGSSLHRWGSTERELHRLRTQGFHPVSRGAPPAIYTCRRREGRTVHGRTGVSPLNTLQPQPPLRLPPACVRVASTTTEGLHCRERRLRDACTRCSWLVLLHSKSSSLVSGSSLLAFSEEGTPWNGARCGRSLLTLAHVVERVVTWHGVEEEESE
jgi:hypothetical protein